MVSNGNHPLDQSHFDESTLEEYVLGQLLPDEEERIRQHLAVCPTCRRTVAELQAFCHQLSSDLHQALDSAEPGPDLSFDKIAAEWRKPPRRVTLWHRLQDLAPSATTVMLLALFVMAFVLLIPEGDVTALRSLDLADDYAGPPAVVAAATDEGLVIARFAPGSVDVIDHLSYIIDPTNLQFAPNGAWLALQEGRTLHIIQTAGGDTHVRIAVHETADWAWASDSHALAFTDGNGQLMLFEVASQTERVLVPAEEYAWGAPVWSNDSRQIAYAVVIPLPLAGGPHLRQGIWRITPETGYRVELARNSTPDMSLLVPAAWTSDNSSLLAWDVNTSTQNSHPALYQVDATDHSLAPVQGNSQLQGTRLAWPMSAQGTVLAIAHERLVAVHLDEGPRTAIPDQIPWPNMLDWAPNGAWLAYTVTGMAEGEGLFLFSPQSGVLRPIPLPPGATEKAVFWAGIEHLFVIRQPQDTDITELWLVSLTTGQPPQRLLTNARHPQPSPYIGWDWRDVLATQVLPAGD